MRETTDCSAITRLPAIRIGSTVKCGREAWPPRPRIVMLTVSDADIDGPLLNMNVPAG
ncbi:hypothetical protein D3C83_66410 [compost metagenome]